MANDNKNVLTPDTVLFLKGWNYSSAGMPCFIEEKYTLLKYLPKAAKEMFDLEPEVPGWYVEDIEVILGSSIILELIHADITENKVCFKDELEYANEFFIDASEINLESVLFESEEDAEGDIE